MEHQTWSIEKRVTQSKSKTQKQEVDTVSTIELLLTLIGHNMVFITFAISLETHYTNTFHFIRHKTITIVTPHWNRHTKEIMLKLIDRRVIFCAKGRVINTQLS